MTEPETVQLVFHAGRELPTLILLCAAVMVAFIGITIGMDKK